jgi:hypothetical protein
MLTNPASAYSGAWTGEGFTPYSKKKGTNRGGGKGASPRFQRHPRSWLWCLCGGRIILAPIPWTFYLQNARFYSGETRIRTGGTMIFRSVRDPTVTRHRARRAVSKRFLEVTARREPPPNAVSRHAVVVGLWWRCGGRREYRNEKKIPSDGTAQDDIRRVQDPAHLFAPPTSCHLTLEVPDRGREPILTS